MEEKTRSWTREKKRKDSVKAGGSFVAASKVENLLQTLMYRDIGIRVNDKASTEYLQRLAEELLVNKYHKELKYKLPDVPRATYLMVFSPDGTKIASTHGNHSIYVTELATGKNIKILSGHPRTPWCIAFHPLSNNILASGCLSGQVRIWDLGGGSEIWHAKNETPIASLAFHPFERLLVIATYNEIHFWDWSMPQPFAVTKTLDETEKVRYVAFDKTGEKLITGIGNRWPMASAGRLPRGDPALLRDLAPLLRLAQSPSPQTERVRIEVRRNTYGAWNEGSASSRLSDIASSLAASSTSSVNTPTRREASNSTSERQPRVSSDPPRLVTPTASNLSYQSPFSQSRPRGVTPNTHGPDTLAAIWPRTINEPPPRPPPLVPIRGLEPPRLPSSVRSPFSPISRSIDSHFAASTSNSVPTSSTSSGASTSRSRVSDQSCLKPEIARALERDYDVIIEALEAAMKTTGDGFLFGRMMNQKIQYAMLKRYRVTAETMATPEDEFSDESASSSNENNDIVIGPSTVGRNDEASGERSLDPLGRNGDHSRDTTAAAASGGTNSSRSVNHTRPDRRRFEEYSDGNTSEGSKSQLKKRMNEHRTDDASSRRVPNASLSSDDEITKEVTRGSTQASSSLSSTSGFTVSSDSAFQPRPSRPRPHPTDVTDRHGVDSRESNDPSRHPYARNLYERPFARSTAGATHSEEQLIVNDHINACKNDNGNGSNGSNADEENGEQSGYWLLEENNNSDGDHENVNDAASTSGISRPFTTRWIPVHRLETMTRLRVVSGETSACSPREETRPEARAAKPNAASSSSSSSSTSPLVVKTPRDAPHIDLQEIPVSSLTTDGSTFSDIPLNNDPRHEFLLGRKRLRIAQLEMERLRKIEAIWKDLRDKITLLSAYGGPSNNGGDENSPSTSAASVTSSDLRRSRISSLDEAARSKRPERATSSRQGTSNFDAGGSSQDGDWSANDARPSTSSTSSASSYPLDLRSNGVGNVEEEILGDNGSGATSGEPRKRFPWAITEVARRAARLFSANSQNHANSGGQSTRRENTDRSSNDGRCSTVTRPLLHLVLDSKLDMFETLMGAYATRPLELPSDLLRQGLIFNDRLLMYIFLKALKWIFEVDKVNQGFKSGGLCAFYHRITKVLDLAAELTKLLLDYWLRAAASDIWRVGRSAASVAMERLENDVANNREGEWSHNLEAEYQVPLNGLIRIEPNIPPRGNASSIRGSRLSGFCPNSQTAYLNDLTRRVGEIAGFNVPIIRVNNRPVNSDASTTEARISGLRLLAEYLLHNISGNQRTIQNPRVSVNPMGRLARDLNVHPGPFRGFSVHGPRLGLLNARVFFPRLCRRLLASSDGAREPGNDSDDAELRDYISPSVSYNIADAQIYRIQAWDFSNAKIPNIKNRKKNVVVEKCKIHNDASIDISSDGKLLATLLPLSGANRGETALGVYSLQWKSLGKRLHSGNVYCETPVSLSLSPTGRYLLVGLALRRLAGQRIIHPFGMSYSQIASIYELEQANSDDEARRGYGIPSESDDSTDDGFGFNERKNEEAESSEESGSDVGIEGRLPFNERKNRYNERRNESIGNRWTIAEGRCLRNTRDVVTNMYGMRPHVSINCIKWAPQSGQGMVYATSTGELNVLY